METTEAYGMFVQAAAYHGWPIVSYRRFSMYLSVLEERSLLRRTVFVGSVSILQIQGVS